MKKSSKQQGFTLIEIVIAISLLGIIMLSGYGALSQLIRSKFAIEDQADLRRMTGSVIVRMSRELQLANRQESLLPPRENIKKLYPSTISLIGETKQLSNNERGDSITFLAMEGGQYLPDGGTHSGLVQIRYRVEENPEQTDVSNEQKTYLLIRDETPKQKPYDEAYKKTMTFPLTDQLLSFRIRYFDQKEEVWRDTWGEGEQIRLPRLLEFSLTLRSPRGRVETHSSVIALRAAT